MKVTDEQIIEAWREYQNYAMVGRVLDIARQTAQARVMHLRAKGIDLPPSRPVGYQMTSERAREIAGLRKKIKTNDQA